MILCDALEVSPYTVLSGINDKYNSCATCLRGAAFTLYWEQYNVMSISPYSGCRFSNNKS